MSNGIDLYSDYLVEEAMPQNLRYGAKMKNQKGGPKGKMRKTAGRNQMDAFLDRTARILDLSKNEIKDRLHANPYKAFRLNGLHFSSLTEEQRSEKVDLILKELSELGVPVEQIQWYRDGFRFPADQTPAVASSKAFSRGEIFIQNPTSWIPVLMLNPNPGQQIVDMCSSPGGKAMHIATITGRLPVMNEPKAHRFSGLLRSLRESGFDISSDDPKLVNADGKHLPSLLTLGADGQIIVSPNSAITGQGLGIADAVLVDAECSNEAGINLASGDPLKGWSQERVERCARLQVQLLSSAYKLVKPGGKIVYSTCTLAPEENEGVVAEVVQRIADKGGELTPVVVDVYPEGKSPAVKKYRGANYPDAISSAVTRIAPGTDGVMDSFCSTTLVRTR
jgi:16S rRNA C967 or C1407 C5-methylase (RsmB/RsmF family)